GLAVLDEDVPVAVLVEHARVEQLVLEILATPAAAGHHEIAVRIGRLRILVEVLHVRVGRRRVEVEVVLLHILAGVPLAVGQSEQPLLEDGVLAVPQRQRETEELLIVGDAGEPVLAPPVGPGAGLVMAEVVPCVAVLAVILADGPPLPLGEIWSPLAPRCRVGPCFFQPLVFGVHRKNPPGSLVEMSAATPTTFSGTVP